MDHRVILPIHRVNADNQLEVDNDDDGSSMLSYIDDESGEI